jgi:hypothetical protein
MIPKRFGTRLGILGTTLLTLTLVPAISAAPCIQNGDFSLGPQGWNLNQGGTSGTARISGGFLELSVSFANDYAEARQTCNSTAFMRTVTVDVDDLGLGTTRFQMGWGASDGTNADLETISSDGSHSVTTSDPTRDTIIFRADRLVLGVPSAQALDNVVVVEVTREQVTNCITSEIIETNHTALVDTDFNGDMVTDAADLVTFINEANSSN